MQNMDLVRKLYSSERIATGEAGYATIKLKNYLNEGGKPKVQTEFATLGNAQFFIFSCEAKCFCGVATAYGKSKSEAEQQACAQIWLNFKGPKDPKSLSVEDKAYLAHMENKVKVDELIDQISMTQIQYKEEIRRLEEEVADLKRELIGSNQQIEFWKTAKLSEILAKVTNSNN